MASTTKQVTVTTTRLRRALDALAEALVARGAPAHAPFAAFAVPSRAAMASLDPAAAIEWAIALVHAVFRERALPSAVTAATKGVGNAARALRRALEVERLRRAAGRSAKEPRHLAA